MEKFLVQSNLINHFKRHKSALMFSFIVGLLIGSIPFIYEFRESFRVQKGIQEQRKLQLQNKEKICKDDTSDYQKFLSLGFPKTAIEKFNVCMKEL